MEQQLTKTEKKFRKVFYDLFVQHFKAILAERNYVTEEELSKRIKHDLANHDDKRMRETYESLWLEMSRPPVAD